VVLTALGLAFLSSRKVRQSLLGRRGGWQRMADQLRARDPAQPLVWFHTTSVGEFLQARPVIERLQADGVPCAVTLYSISGYRWLSRIRAQLPGVIMADYLPLDFRHNARRLLALLRPAAVVHVKFDLWPNLVWEVAAAGVPQFLISGTLHEKSLRQRHGVARAFYGAVYGALDGIYAVTEADRQRFLAACPDHPRVRVFGDTRFDSVLDRKRTLQPPALPSLRGKSSILIVGSSWPPDEAVIFPPIQQALRERPELGVILVPHEIDGPHLDAIEAAFRPWGVVRFSARDAAATDARVVLVDSVGQLSALYAHATLAYVGGAFTTGVHNVMEPAAMGVPAMFGPRYHNSPEAMELLAQGCAFSIADAPAFHERLQALLADAAATVDLGRRAQAYIEDQAGASQRCFAVIKETLA
jgi:3-deoxy-D-manno-octulosonic-acid transferase